VPPRDQPAAPAAVPAAGSSVHEGGRALVGAGEVGGDPPHGAAQLGLVDWHRTGRRLCRQALVILVGVVAAWLILGFSSEGPTIRSFAELLGLGVLVAVAGEIAIVGGAALRGMLAAGARGDRLAASDVSLLPPQISRRLRNRGR
jgi:hypothetical protein